MLSLIPKISWNSSIPGPDPPSGTAQYASKLPPSPAVIVSYLVVMLMEQERRPPAGTGTVARRDGTGARWGLGLRERRCCPDRAADRRGRRHRGAHGHPPRGRPGGRSQRVEGAAGHLRRRRP